ncbi:MAG: response regulator [Bacteroidota bacterium]
MNTNNQRSKDKTILIVEDEMIIAMDIKYSLMDMGYTDLSIVFSGEKALEVIEQKDFDLIFMDLRLAGGMDGIETAKAILDKKHIPIVFTTANIDEQILNQLGEISAYGHVSKPMNQDDIRTTMSTVFEKANNGR